MYCCSWTICKIFVIMTLSAATEEVLFLKSGKGKREDIKYCTAFLNISP